jgi:riboflavin synthase
MFTGLVEEVGKIQSIKRSSVFGEITIQANVVLEGIKLGDSIAVNGICLTTIRFDNKQFTVQVMKETLEKTSLAFLNTGMLVNLERALLPTTRLGGHFVSGHVDGLGKLEKISSEGPAKILYFSVSNEMTRFMVPKGSITIDGVSLTLIEVGSQHFTVGIIPHTQGASTLAGFKIGDQVNIETDMLGKYCSKLLSFGKEDKKKDSLLDQLTEMGF